MAHYSIDDVLHRQLTNLYTAQSVAFDDLARAAELDPKRDFRSRDLRGLSLTAADLRGFDFSNSDLRGTNLRLARAIDKTTRLAGALLDQEDAAWHQQWTRNAPITEAELAKDLPFALARGQFHLLFEPRLSIRQCTITGAEVLLRWRHPDQGNISPVRYVPLLEDSGLIEPVTYWAIETAIEQRALLRSGLDLAIAVNVPPFLIERPEFVADCRRLVSGQRAELRFEISESALLSEPEAVVCNIQELTNLGIKVTLDDYGSGFSSLSTLKRVPASELKIDSSFVRQLLNSNVDPLVVRSMIDLGHALGWAVAADGVESPQQLALLSVMGCDSVQGHLIGRPMEISQLVDFIRAGEYSSLLPRPDKLVGEVDMRAKA